MNLKELHELIKDHPYRLAREDKYLKPYQKWLYKLGDAFYDAIKDNKLYSESRDLIHDFNYAIRYLHETDSAPFYHTERCIGVIHTYIDTGEVPFYYTWYTGVNHLASLPRVRKMVFDSSDGKYYPDYSVEQLDHAIKEIDFVWVSASPEYKAKLEKYNFGIHSKAYREYLVKLRERKQDALL